MLGTSAAMPRIRLTKLAGHPGRRPIRVGSGTRGVVEPGQPRVSLPMVATLSAAWAAGPRAAAGIYRLMATPRGRLPCVLSGYVGPSRSRPVDQRLSVTRLGRCRWCQERQGGTLGARWSLICQASVLLPVQRQRPAELLPVGYHFGHEHPVWRPPSADPTDQAQPARAR
jgi:hypothetical protein